MQMPLFSRRSYLWWISLVWVLCGGRSHAQTSEWSWEYFGPEQGLGMSFLDIIQDSRGFIWLGASNGLYRYDGYKFQSFKKYTNRSTGLSSDWVWDLEEDARGNIWIATYDGGINLWERATGRFRHFRHEPGNPQSLSGDKVFKILPDKQGQVWAVVVQDKNGVPVLDKLDPATGWVRRYRHEPGNPISLSSDTISVSAFQAMQLHPLCMDANGSVWVATHNGLNLYVPETDSFRRFRHDPDNPQSLSFPKAIGVQASAKYPGVMWVRTASADLKEIALDRMELGSGKVHRVQFPDAGAVPLGMHFTPDEEEVWISNTSLRRYQLDAVPQSLQEVPLPKEAGISFGLFAHSSGNLLLAPRGIHPMLASRGSDNYVVNSGVLLFSPQSRQLISIDNNPLKPGQVFDEVFCFLEDRSGLVWIGTGIGLYKLRLPQEGKGPKPVFETYFPFPESGLLSSEIRDVWEESPNVFWLATHGGGLSRLDRRSGKITTFTHQPANPYALRHNRVHALHGDPSSGQLWVGHEKGIDVLDLNAYAPERPGTARFVPLRHPSGVLNGRMNDIEPDGKGKLWIGTAEHGLLLFHPPAAAVLQQITFEHSGNTSGNYPFINKVFTASDGQVWVAPGMGGLCKLTPQGDAFHQQCYMEGLFIVDFLEGPDGKLWCAAMNYGLLKFDAEAEQYELISMENRLMRNSITGIKMDQLGRIWLTSIGLTRYDPKVDTYKIYGRDDGVAGLDPDRCFFKSKAGELFYASRAGALQIFKPENVTDNPTLPKIAFTDFKLFNQSVPPGPKSPLREQIEVGGAIRLTHHQHSFSIEFAGLEFTQPRENQYRYQLLGADKEPVFSGTHREARYTSVKPGRYTFRVQASNNDGVWMEDWASIDIIIAPPWWMQGWAFALYVLTFAAGLFAFFAYQRKRWQQKTALDMERLEAGRRKELEEAKARLYANITHEFRTPLTVIGGMADQIEAEPSKLLATGVKTIKRNTAQLLQLVNQMLDLQKLEAGAMKAEMVQGDVVKYLAYLTTSFDSLAKAKSVSLHFEAAQPSLIMDYDPDLLLHILSNLISNAVKFNKEGGEVRVVVGSGQEGQFSDAECLVLKVSDTGCGIPEDKLPFIFDRFYQVDDSSTRTGEGTGIGLALVQELVKLLGGAIRAESRIDEGSTFTVELPIRREAPPASRISPEVLPFLPASEWDVADTMPEVALPAENGNGKKPAKSTLLIVEDNRELSQYLQSCLAGDYRLIFAFDGAEGIEKAIEQVPDLIISDVMMPRKDGFELCETLKTDERTSHIPIVLLTAKVDAESRLRGLRRGADAYLGKPFQLEELRLHLRNMEELRRRLRIRYKTLELPAEPMEDPSVQMEDAFVQKAREAVEAHMDDPAFQMPRFCRALGVSRTQLHKKLKAVTGHSATGFIRQVRLEHGRHLLRTTDLSVSEVANAVGFDPNYFSRCYVETFGVRPTEERASKRS